MDKHELEQQQRLLAVQRLVKAKDWDAARELLEELHRSEPTSRVIADLLRMVEKEQASVALQRDAQFEVGTTANSRQELIYALYGIGLLVAVGFLTFKTVGSLQQFGWNHDVLITRGVSRSGQPYEWWLPVSTTLTMIPVGVIGALGLFVLSFRGFRVN